MNTRVRRRPHGIKDAQVDVAHYVGQWRLPRIFDNPVAPLLRCRIVELACSGLGPRHLSRMLSEGLLEAPSQDGVELASTLDTLGVRCVLPSDDEYPKLLKHIDSPAPMLFAKGQRLDELGPFVAIVGSRICTPGSLKFTHNLGASLAQIGVCIVSGLARGIDGAAHTGAVETGSSLAVLGCGIDRVYPAEHAALTNRLLEVGAIIGEFPPGIRPQTWHFPARNRIVSGVSAGVIVVEAGIGSGALITANFALEQGREVFACAVAPYNVSGAGIRELLRDGATIVLDEQDAIEKISDLTGLAASAREQLRIPELCGTEAEVYGALVETLTVEDVITLSGLAASEVASALSRLALKGHVSEEGGGRYSRR